MRMNPSPIPLSTIVAMAANCRATGQCSMDLILQISVLTFFEPGLFGTILGRLYTTAGVLKEAKYLKFRSKQVGLHLSSFPYRYVLFNDRFSPVSRLLDYAIISMTAYVNLSTDSAGFMGWFRGTREEGEDGEKLQPEMIGLKMFDDQRHKKFNIQEMSTRMIYQLHIEIFNASDLACTWNSPRHAMVAARQNFLCSSGCVKELEVFDETSETYVTILASYDRILITFKDASPVGYIKADANIKMVSISDFIPSNKASTHPMLSKRAFTRDVLQPTRLYVRKFLIR